MAKSKSKDEIKATIVEEEVESTSVEDVKKTNPQAKETIEKTEEEEKPAQAKAGKRSAKGQKEAEAKAEKIEQQKTRDKAETESEPKPKPAVKPARSRLERRSKGYRKSAELIDKSKEYSLKEALDLATKTSHVKFDAAVELHVRLNIDPKQADQNIRDSVVLPAGTGKTIRIATLTEENDNILAKLEKGQIDFDVLIATPNMMSKLAKYARLLGPKGLMPNPKSGTVTQDVNKAAEQAKAGKIEYRTDSNGIIHVAVGKVSFGGEKLETNARAALDSIKHNKPTSVKGVYVKSLTVTTSMGPAIRMAPNE